MSRANKPHQELPEDFYISMEAITSGNTELLANLAPVINQSIFNLQTEDGWSLLHIAIDYGNTEICQIVAEHTKNKDCRNQEGLAAIHIAVLNGQDDIYSILKEQGCDTTLRTTQNLTAQNFKTNDGKIIPRNSTIYDIIEITNQSELPYLRSSNRHTTEAQSPDWTR